MLSKISSEIQVFNLGHQPSGRFIFILARMWRSVVIFRRQEGPTSKKVWETLD